MASSFDGRHTVVTGGTGALGGAVVERLVSGGCTVTVPVFSAPELERFPLRDHERVHVVEGVDLTDAAGAASFYDGAVEVVGPLWASVHVAGGFHMGPIDGEDASVWDRMMNLNGKTCYLCCRETARILKRQKTDGACRGGRIVNVAARPALVREAGAGMVAYAASKSAVASITQGLAAELNSSGIWVNGVVPSVLDTPANRAAMPDADHDAWPKPAEIAETIAFLASSENRVTRGALVPVYGRS